jgi:hypothetical protein
MEVSGELHAQAAFTRETTRYPLNRRLGKPQTVWRREKSLAPCKDSNPGSQAARRVEIGYGTRHVRHVTDLDT